MGVSGSIDLTIPSVVPTSILNDPNGDGHLYQYTVDLGASPTFVLTGDFEPLFGAIETNYSEIVGAPYPGSFSINAADGMFTYTVTLAQVQAGPFSTASISLIGTNSGATDTDILQFNFVVCFAADTAINTPDGERPIQDLTCGDRVVTADGREVSIKWIGRISINPMFNPADRLEPVRIRKGALGDNIPTRDLIVTADHGMIVDDIVINAGALVNGTSIDWYPWKALGRDLTYYHIETEEHEIILANGAATETYLDAVSRRSFDNFAEYEALYGEERVIVENPLPRISSARLVPQAIRNRLGTDTAA